MSSWFLQLCLCQSHPPTLAQVKLLQHPNLSWGKTTSSALLLTEIRSWAGILSVSWSSHSLRVKFPPDWDPSASAARGTFKGTLFMQAHTSPTPSLALKKMINTCQLPSPGHPSWPAAFVINSDVMQIGPDV